MTKLWQSSKVKDKEVPTLANSDTNTDMISTNQYRYQISVLVNPISVELYGTAPGDLVNSLLQSILFV